MPESSSCTFCTPCSPDPISNAFSSADVSVTDELPPVWEKLVLQWKTRRRFQRAPCAARKSPRHGSFEMRAAGMDSAATAGAATCVSRSARAAARRSCALPSSARFALTMQSQKTYSRRRPSWGLRCHTRDGSKFALRHLWAKQMTLPSALAKTAPAW